jgi:DNA replication initiation complex subunit (GINS family)
MELTNKQKDYIDSFIIYKQLDSDNLDEIHEEVYESMLDNYIIDLEKYSDEEFEEVETEYNNLVWDYIESKI